MDMTRNDLTGLRRWIAIAAASILLLLGASGLAGGVFADSDAVFADHESSMNVWEDMSLPCPRGPLADPNATGASNPSDDDGSGNDSVGESCAVARPS